LHRVLFRPSIRDVGFERSGLMFESRRLRLERGGLLLELRDGLLELRELGGRILRTSGRLSCQAGAGRRFTDA
jgi:hypothetical protein